MSLYCFIILHLSPLPILGVAFTSELSGLLQKTSHLMLLGKSSKLPTHSSAYFTLNDKTVVY
jgi:hypothetical protein